MRKSNSLIAVALSISLVGINPAFAAEKAANAAVDPWVLAAGIYENPKAPYQARVLMNRWKEQQSNMGEVEVYYYPPDLYRMEFYSYKGEVERVVQSDSVREKVTLYANGVPTRTYSYPRPQKLRMPADEMQLMKKNYKPSISGVETVLGRPTWTLVLTPLSAGKPVSTFKVDQATRMVMEMRRSIGNDQYGSATRLVSFEPNKQLSRALFLSAIENDSPEDTFSKSNSLNRDEIQYSMQKYPSFTRLPGGFSINGASRFEVAETPAQQFLFTDGLLQLSIFETTHPVQFPASTTSEKGVSVVSLGSQDQVISMRSGPVYYTLIGEMSPGFLKDISSDLKKQ